MAAADMQARPSLHRPPLGSLGSQCKLLALPGGGQLGAQNKDPSTPRTLPLRSMSLRTLLFLAFPRCVLPPKGARKAPQGAQEAPKGAGKRWKA
eukprot:7927930-Alexandrium_andersonii.AAC.1